MPDFQTKLVRHKNSLSSSIIKVPDHIAKTLIQKRKDKRVICTINDQYTYHCALLPDGNGGYYIMVNKQIRKKLGIDFVHQLNITVRVDPTEYGMLMPEEFKEVLNTDPEGQDYFESLSPGKQRSLLHMIGKVKDTDLRITKSLIIMGHLKRRNGDLDYKRLNEDFKQKREF